jgi:hypothetical protein
LWVREDPVAETAGEMEDKAVLYAAIVANAQAVCNRIDADDPDDVPRMSVGFVAEVVRKSLISWVAAGPERSANH